MKKFIENIEGFSEIKLFFRKVIIFVVIFLLLDMVLVPLFLVTSKKFVHSAYYEIKNADCLIFGASHSSFALNPSIINEYGLTAVNYSKGGHNSVLNYYLYEKYRKEFSPPKVVIISCPYFNFSAETDSETIFNLLSYSEFAGYMFSNIFEFKLKLFKYRKILSDMHTQIFKSIFSEKKPIRKIGYLYDFSPELKNTNLTTNIQIPSDRVVYFKEDYVEDGYSKKDISNKEIIEYFHKLLKILQKDNVFVVLVEIPEYIGTRESILNKEIFYKEVKEEIKEYTNTIFINQTEIESFDFEDKTLFFDGGYGLTNSHLSYKGSNQYTKILMNMLGDKIR